MRNLTKTESALLSLISNALFDTKLELDEDIDWNKLEKEAYAQAVFTLAFYKNNAPIEKYKQKIGLGVSNNLSVNADHAYVNLLMNENGIPYVILKGYASAYYYPEPMYRSMGDVDFLVPAGKFDKAKEILISNGYTPNPENHICHISFKNGTSILELHFAPAGMPEGEAGEIAKEYMKDVFKTSKKIETPDGEMVIPDFFHHGLILLLHTCHHLTGEGVGLRHLCDWAVFANNFTNEQFEEIFKEKLKKIGLWKFVQLLTALSIKYLGMPKKAWATENEDDELLSQMMIDIFDGGNFGIKDNTRKHETMIISSRGKNGVGNTSMLGQFIKSMNNIVYLKWKISKKLKFLLPFGWLFYGTRYLIRMAFGKRDKININQTVEKANERRNIYKEFDLFETQN